MGLAYATTAAVSIWLILYSIGVKALDAALVMLTIILLAAVVKILVPYIPGNRQRS